MALNQMSLTQEDIIKTLRNLSLKIKREIEEGISQGMLQPEEGIYSRWKVNEFEYSEGGVTKYSASGENITKKTWFKASHKVADSTRKSNEYSSALELLAKLAGTGDEIVAGLERFIEKLISSILTDSTFNEVGIETLITIFLKDLKEEPLKLGAEVELDGIVILAPGIHFKVGDTNILLRQTTIEDLEKEVPLYGFSEPRLRPSAILNFEFLGRQANEIQMKVEQAITILRLFRVGSVKAISYSMHSESFTNIALGTLSSGERLRALDKYVITEGDVENLKKFWQAVVKALPQSFYELGEVRLDHKDIAYKRYCDALLLNGMSERRIANAVMGLESLFLKGEEKQELVYRLRIRVAKMFALLGHDPHKVRDTVGDAYEIRSLFVHGGHLAYKDEKKLNTTYGDIRTFLKFILDYLRISIIIWAFIKKGKEELLDLIDDALIAKDKENLLNGLLSTARNIVS